MFELLWFYSDIILVLDCISLMKYLHLTIQPEEKTNEACLEFLDSRTNDHRTFNHRTSDHKKTYYENSVLRGSG